MTVYHSIPGVDRLELFAHPEGRDIKVYDGSKLLGWIFPVVVGQPDRGWFAREPGWPAERFATEKAALEHLAGRPVNVEEDR